MCYLKEVYVGSTPPTCIGSESPFTNGSSSVTLYVPKGCLSLYQNADVWKDFSNIIEIELNKEVFVEAGNLSNVLPSVVSHAKISGTLNGTDVKYLRHLINDMNLTELDLSDAKFVSGGEAYYENYTTSEFAITNYMFFECRNLTSIILPTSLYMIGERAFAYTGLKSIDIPNSISTLGLDCFAYCPQLFEVKIGSNVNICQQGVFWTSTVKNVYVKALTPPSISAYLFSSNPNIYVYSSVLNDYLNSSWNEFGTFIVNNTAVVSEAGNLSNILPSAVSFAKISGTLNGTDIKYLRHLINDENLTELDLSDVRFVAGGEAYYENYTTSDDILTDYMFFECRNLTSIILPTSVVTIGERAFAYTGLLSIEIPNNIHVLSLDCFAYCPQLYNVMLGNNVNTCRQGVFWASTVRNVFVKPTTPPYNTVYLFSSNPKIHVYSSVLNDYLNSSWNEFGTFIGDLDTNNITIEDIDGNDILDEYDVLLLSNFVTSNNTNSVMNKYIDLNKDDKITVTDMVALVKKMLESR